MFFDSAKARDELGYSPRRVETALAEAVEFFRKTGLARDAA
jgi:nucleoside-diphosphate-sugar epimerase